ncbi:alpha/beta fold family hydrolase [Gloeomargarita lithophora Alchichica-D10]|uniref:Alpha/beta fold family hydrolase n=1 Tax=Gloeomargarita lithophora Alchichica-D10 TaxID=1188229 RepID=A0A1J0ABR3_9CYAN|nr:alpha/beta fold hydrolase [Gloeomargarita lithophora]APB33368.1 alpha/beta fold family hydrolase [Gloeomargarita lithophora Alchichica-D10]
MDYIWRGYPIRYQRAGAAGAPVVLVHGFGASSDHWRHNLAVLGQHHQAFALDLLGFGGSAKPLPGTDITYTFETWGALVADFIREVVGQPAAVAGNSIGGIVALQAAVFAPERVTQVALLNPSLRLLHRRKRQELPWYRRWGAPLFQNLLGWEPFGVWFFQRLAQPRVIRQVLQQAYARRKSVTDELVQLLYKPSQDPGAAQVFLAFVRYSDGPLLADLLPQVTCPVLLVWGEADPWEPLALGKNLAAQFPQVIEFITLPGVGHCPQDEAPELVNPLLLAWLNAQSSPLGKV